MSDERERQAIAEALSSYGIISRPLTDRIVAALDRVRDARSEDECPFGIPYDTPSDRSPQGEDNGEITN